MTVFLYDVKRKVELTLRETGGTVNWNLPMNRNDFRVFKDVFNSIEFVVRNTDRKPINMMGRFATINLYDHRTDKLLFSKDLKITNEAKGICKLEISPDVTADWFLQTYSYSVEVKNADGTRHMLYVDQNEGQRGFFELAQGPRFDAADSIEIAWKQLTLTERGLNGSPHSYRVSDALPGSMQRNNTTGLHTAMFDLKNYTGQITIQGSTEIGTPADSDWYDIEVLDFHKETGKKYTNFVANLNWVRFWINYEGDNLEVLPADEGEITKLVFRN